MRDFRKYEIWQVGMKVVNSVYSSMGNMPDHEKYGIRSQISRSAVSIPSNIAEGCSRESEKGFKRFLEYSLGSCYELETQLIICETNKFIDSIRIEVILTNLHQLQKQLCVLIIKLK